MRAHGVAWEGGVRAGHRVTAVDDRPVPAAGGLGPAREVVVADDLGATRRLRAPIVSPAVATALLTAALAFAGLGGAVVRWSPDPAAGAVFLIFSGAVATALAAMPAAALGHAWPFFLASASATVAAPAFSALCLVFPSPLAWSRWALRALVPLTGALLLAMALATGSGQAWSDRLDRALWAWFGLHLVAGVVVLAARAVFGHAPRALAPIAVGAAVGLTPLVALNVVPILLGHSLLLRTEVGAAGAAAIPVAFAYSILRHRLFALDAFLGGALVAMAATAAAVVAFFAAWELLTLLRGPSESSVVAAAVAAVVASPLVVRVARAGLERWLLRPLPSLAVDGEAGTDALESIGRAVVVHARRVVPARRAALYAIPEPPPAGTPPTWRLIAADGVDEGASAADPPLLVRVQFADTAVAPDGAAVAVPIVRAGERIGALVAGPRLDASPFGGIDRGALGALALRAAAPLNAAILHRRATDEAAFRDGLAHLVAELAATTAEARVLDLAAVHARALLAADAVAVWRREASRPTLVTSSGDSTLALLDVTSDADAGARRLVIRLDEDGPGGAVAVVARATPPTAADQRRAVEIAGQINGALGRARALAQAAEADTLRELNRVKTEFLDAVTHDLQHPFTVVRGFAELLQGRVATDPDQVTRVAIHIQAAIASGQRLIDDLLATSRLERGVLSLQRETIEAGTYLRELARSYQALPRGERIHLDGGDGLTIWADPARLEQMIGNLLTNALRYGRTGPILLRAVPGSGGDVSIEVRDFGPGIPLEDQPHVWEKFYRAPGGQRVARGSGVGLSVVRTLAELHGGRAELESTPGNGCTFRIVLPDAPPDHERGEMLN